MVKCSRCNKRLAVVFLTKIENGETKQEGLCIKCAKELGIKPVEDVLNKIGLDDEALDQLDNEMESLMEAGENGELPVDLSGEGDEENPFSRAPLLNLQKLMQEGVSDNSKSGEKNISPKKRGEKNKKENQGKNLKFLSTYTQNLTERAREGGLDSIVGRDRELERVMQILCRRQKNNPCLIGEPGVGKTAIAEALAIRIAKGNVPYKLKDHDICLLDLTALVAGTQFRGQFESRVLGLLNDVREKGNVILVIDEVHNIVGAGDAEGSMNA
ncbi:MAG: ATP-dependent Clp protease ATP-binding subunit, partial [Clostridia bacterium]|nr:ATP-dependent Clp protease ATP-binding subunit [Clostridia bacterium]